METGLQIKLLREHHHISRDSMADLLNMSVNTYTKIETGERIPNLKELEKISEKLEVDPSVFFKKDGVFISNVNNSPGVGYGNTVTIDKDLLNTLIETLKKLNKFLDK